MKREVVKGEKEGERRVEEPRSQKESHSREEEDICWRKEIEVGRRSRKD